jgi:hypothetical protein
LPPAASPNVRHRGNPSCVRVFHDSIVLAPDGAFPTSGARLLAFGRAVSSIVPVLPRLVSNYFLNLLLDHPFGQQSQMLRVTTKIDAVQTGTRLGLQRRPLPQPTSFYALDSRYLIRHNVPPSRSGERAASSLTRVTGYRRSPHDGTDNAQLFTQPRTLRIKQENSLNFSTVGSISPLRACPILHSTPSNFHEFSRATGPTRQERK